MRDVILRQARRRGDALADDPQDTAFVAEVKRLARARGFSANSLGVKIGAHRSEVKRRLRPGEHATFAKTAELYADALEVDRRYLRLLALGKIDASIDAADASRAFRLLFDTAAPALSSLRLRELWYTAVAAANEDTARACRALAIPLCEELRLVAEAACGIEPKPRTPFVVLKNTLNQLGIDIAPYQAEVGPSVLFDLWLMISGTISPEDRDEIVDAYREKLRQRDAYHPAMDLELETGKHEIRTLANRRDTSQ